MKFINDTENTVFVALGKGFPVKAGEICDVPDGYAMPRRYDNGSRRPSVIEEIAPQLLPANEADRLKWAQAPEAPTRRATSVGIPTVASLVASGVPLGAAEMIVKQSAQAILDSFGKDEAPAKKEKR